MSRARGAVLYETAIVLPLVLLLTLSSIRFGLAGYAQMQSDAASWTTARYAALGIPNPVAQSKALFPGTNPYNYPTPVANPAPTASAPINWNQSVACQFSNSIGCGGSGYQNNLSLFNRHGGSSVIVPMLETTKVQTSDSTGTVGWFAVLQGNLTKLLNITSTNVEPYYQECGQLFMYQFTSDACVTGASGTNVSDWSNKTTPPYYMSTTYLQYCASPAAQEVNNTFHVAFTNWTGWQNCALTAFTALGGGAQLNLHNYYRTTPGANGMDITTGATVFPVFRELACHQRVYAALSATLDSSGNMKAPIVGNNNYLIYNLDANLGGANSLVATIYGWDLPISQYVQVNGPSGNYPDQVPGNETHPLAGCGSPVNIYANNSPTAASTITP